MRSNIIIIVLLLIVTTLTAQDENKKTPTFKTYSVGISVGYYQPNMGYWNNTYLPLQNVSNDFQGNSIFSGYVNFVLPRGFRTRLGISYFKETVKDNENSSIKSLSIGLRRIGLAVLYAPEYISFIGIQPYMGGEGHFYNIKNKLDVRGITSEQQGQDYSFAPVVGIDRPFGHVNLGLEFMYNIGSYTQDVTDGIGVAKQKVSINGPELRMNIGYCF